MRQFFIILTAAAALLCSCDDDNKDNKDKSYAVAISDVRQVPASTDIDQVRAIINYGTSSTLEYTLATSDYSNSFTINLPATVGSQYLQRAEFHTDLKVSDRDAMVSGPVYLAAYDGASRVGWIYHATLISSQEEYLIYYIYSDRAFTVKGEYDEDGYDYYTYDLKMKKGWNRVVEHWTNVSNNEIESTRYSNDVPSDAQWFFTDVYIPEPGDNQ